MLPMGRKTLPTMRDAEALAMQALVFMTEDETRLARFFNDSGMTPAALSAAADQPETLVAVLDHLLADESLLLMFAANTSHQPSDIGLTRAILAGDDQVSSW